MPKYIESATAAEIVSQKHNIPLADLVDTFAEIPAADVAPVVHGQWVPTAANSDELYNCSNCHCFSDRETYFHCPWCGAKMNSERSGTSVKGGAGK